MDNLPDSVFRNILEWVGLQGQFLFVATVNHRFYDGYNEIYRSNHHHHKTSYSAAFSSISRSKMIIEQYEDYEDFTTKVCRVAAQNGNLEVLKWARKEGLFWDSDTCAQAARGGHLDVLKWARANGCPWGIYT